MNPGTSLWKAISKRTTNYPELSGDLEVDVVIVGGGITGITAAHELIKAGKKVALLEANQIGGVTTGSSTGNLYIPVQPFYHNIASSFDEETAKNVALSRKFAIDYIEKIVNEENIQCHFHRRPWYAYSNNENNKILEKEIDIFNKIGIAITPTNSLPLDLPYKKAIIMEQQARFNPLQYVISMADALKTAGGLLFENTKVIKFIEKQDFCLVETKNAKIKSHKIILATHTPIGVNPTQFFTAPYRSYVVAVTLKHGIYPEGHFWDLDQPPDGHHAICTHAMNNQNPELLVIAGNHHKTGQGTNTVLRYQALEDFLRKQFLVEDVKFSWSAQHFQSADNIPYIGFANRLVKNTYLATGYFADGLIYGTLAGLIISDHILKKNNSWDELYNANRFKPLSSANFVLRENANIFLQYLKDLPFTKKNEYQDLQPGDGRIVEINREKCAVSRDENNKLHIVSAICTHMKCIVNWNNAEKTWDCPCHGSRFTKEGKVLEGPAMEDLKKINQD